jgi:hypothetical protein
MNFPLQSFVWYSTIRLLTTSKILSFGPVSSGPDEFAATDGQMDGSSPFFADVPTVHPEPAALTFENSQMPPADEVARRGKPRRSRRRHSRRRQTTAVEQFGLASDASVNWVQQAILVLFDCLTGLVAVAVAEHFAWRPRRVVRMVPGAVPRARGGTSEQVERCRQKGAKTCALRWLILQEREPFLLRLSAVSAAVC